MPVTRTGTPPNLPHPFPVLSRPTVAHRLPEEVAPHNLIRYDGFGAQVYEVAYTLHLTPYSNTTYIK